MPNKISGLVTDPPPLGAGRPANKVRDAATGSPAPATSSGTSSGASAGAGGAPGEVHITESASQLATLEQAVRNLPAVDPVRVAQFSSAIEQGTYTVEPRHVADQLLRLEQALGHLPKE